MVTFDNSLSKSLLKIDYISAKQSIIDMTYDLIKKGLIPFKEK